jgi:hypothetical protein
MDCAGGRTPLVQLAPTALQEELFVGTLIYTVVLGFFDDDTSIVEATSFRYIFLAAIVLEVLTCLVLAAKDTIDGFLGVFAVAIVVTVAHRLADLVFIRLGTATPGGPSANTT